MLVLAISNVAAAETRPTNLPAPAALLQEIDSSGPREVIRRLEQQNLFDPVCAAIETGSPSWLEVARRLAPGSDASSALCIDYAVARALPRAPSRVLALIGRGFTVEDVCTSPFIEPEPGVAEAYQQRAAKALRSLPPSRIRDDCLRGVEVPLHPITP